MHFSAKIIIHTLAAVIGVPVVAFSVARARLTSRKPDSRPRLFWGAAPIKALIYSSQAMRARGYKSDTGVIELYGNIPGSEFDHHFFADGRQQVGPRGYFENLLRAYFGFGIVICNYDIVHLYFDGGPLQRTMLAPIEHFLIKQAGRKLVLMPYGSDSFVYDRIADQGWRAALLINYQKAGRNPARIERRIRAGCRYADCVVGCLVHTVNLPRIDVWPLAWYPVDLSKFEPVAPKTDGPVRIGHAPNHRGAKGTKFLADAVRRLQGEGHAIELDLIEGVSNDEAIARIGQCDVFVDQLIFGYALAAIEAFALGKVVVTGIRRGDPNYTPFERYSYLNECPAFGASPETIYNVLKDLIDRRPTWISIGQASREFAERRHSFEASADLFEVIYRRVWHGDTIDLAALYAPRLF